MYSLLPSFILGFHGCDQESAEAVFAGKAHLHESNNDYDWLGTGVYFWENSPSRALDYATMRAARPVHGQKEKNIRNPAVVGAIIDLGYCLNLLDDKFLKLVKESHELLLVARKSNAAASNLQLPANKPLKGGHDLILRHLDCLVINTLHEMRRDAGLRPFDSVRAAFLEGDPLFKGSGFHGQNHIQVCVRSRSCIKGYFRPLADPEESATKS